jgi:chromate transporter
VLEKFKENRLVKDTFYVLRPAVIGMLAVSFTSMISPLLINFAGQELLEIFNLKAIGLFGLLLFGIMKFKKHPIIYIAIGAVVGIILKF